MKQKTAFVCYYKKENRYSFNALIAAWETDPDFNNIDVHYFQKVSDFTSLKSIIDKYDITILGFSFTTPQIFQIENIMQGLQDLSVEMPHASLLTIAGGPHPTGDPGGTLRMGFDAVFIGEGEQSLMEFIKTIDENNDFHLIKGIAYINSEGKIIYTGKKEDISLNLYPPISGRHKLFGPVEITRGCPHACSFCQTSRMFGNKMRHRSAEQIIQYIKIMKAFHLEAFRAITPNAFSYCRNGDQINYQALEELLSSVQSILKPEGRVYYGTFPSEIRPEDVTEESLALIKKYTDNEQITIGAQFGSDRMLNLSGRGHTVGSILKAASLTKKAGLKACMDFIFFMPEETPDDLKETFSLMKELLKLGASINTHSFLPLAGTPYYRQINNDRHYEQYVEKELRNLGFLIGKWRRQREISFKLAAVFDQGLLKSPDVFG